jgi:hypothetical protein
MKSNLIKALPLVLVFGLAGCEDEGVGGDRTGTQMGDTPRATQDPMMDQRQQDMQRQQEPGMGTQPGAGTQPGQQPYGGDTQTQP